MPYNGRKKRRKQNIYLHNQVRVPTWPPSPDDARLAQESNEDELVRRLKELSRYVDGSPEKASLLGLIDILERRIAADNGLLEFAVRQTPGLVRWQALGNGNCFFFSMSLNVLSLSGKNWDPLDLRNEVVNVLESVPDENSLALSCHGAAANIAVDRHYDEIDELTMMAVSITTNVITTVFTETPGDGHATYTYTPEASARDIWPSSAREFGLPFQMQPFGQARGC